MRCRLQQLTLPCIFNTGSIFSVARELIALFGHDADPQGGLYGAFGYDLTFQFEPVKLKHDRRFGSGAGGARNQQAPDRDLLLYIPDRIVVHDEARMQSWRVSYDYIPSPTVSGPGPHAALLGKIAADSVECTSGLPRLGACVPYAAAAELPEAVRSKRDHAKGEYAKKVATAKEQFKVRIAW